MKTEVKANHPVTIGVYENEFIFNEETDAIYGDPDYDHIVPVIKIESLYDDLLYHDTDVIYFSDNGETNCIGASNKNVCASSATPQFIFSYTFLEFSGTREEANSQTSN